MRRARVVVHSSCSPWERGCRPRRRQPLSRRAGNRTAVLGRWIVAGTYAAGVACPFAVSFEIVSGGTGQQVTFFDGNGDVVRIFNRVTPSTMGSHEPRHREVLFPPAPSRNREDHLRAGRHHNGNHHRRCDRFNAPADSPPGPFSLTNVGDSCSSSLRTAPGRSPCEVNRPTFAQRSANVRSLIRRHAPALSTLCSGSRTAQHENHPTFEAILRGSALSRAGSVWAAASPPTPG